MNSVSMRYVMTQNRHWLADITIDREQGKPQHLSIERSEGEPAPDYPSMVDHVVLRHSSHDDIYTFLDCVANMSSDAVVALIENLPKLQLSDDDSEQYILEAIACYYEQLTGSARATQLPSEVWDELRSVCRAASVDIGRKLNSACDYDSCVVVAELDDDDKKAGFSSADAYAEEWALWASGETYIVHSSDGYSLSCIAESDEMFALALHEHMPEDAKSVTIESDGGYYDGTWSADAVREWLKSDTTIWQFMDEQRKSTVAASQ